MTAFRVEISIGNRQGQRFDTLNALVDTGSTYTWIPRARFAALGIAPEFRREFELADGRVIELDMAVASARLNGQTLPTLVIFGERDTEPLLGVFTLEGFGMAVDPLNERLFSVRGLLK